MLGSVETYRENSCGLLEYRKSSEYCEGSTGQIDTHMEENHQKDDYRFKFYDRFRNTHVKDQTTCVPELRMPLDPNLCLVKHGKLDKVNRKGRTNTMEFFLLEHLICYAAEGAGRLTRAIPLSTVRVQP